MTRLRIATNLSIPVDAVTQKLAFLGRTGSGKTYGATRLAEEMYDAGAQFVALDPVGIWWGLRLAADGRAAGLPVPVFGGLHGDIPLEPTGGALVADLIVDRALSVVLDVSQFEHDTDKARFARDFAARFFFRKKARPSAVHVFIEECQEFVPQNPQKGEEMMLHAFQRLWRLGRNFGVGGSLISQRPQDVSKKALNQSECVFAFQLTGTHERKAVKDWISEKGITDDLDAILPKLAVGEPHVWSPAWLRISETVRIGKKRTFNASATPEVGAAAVEVRPLQPIELEQLRGAMAETIERAKQEDPKALRAEIARLTREVATARKGNGHGTASARLAAPDPAALDAAYRRGELAAQARVQKLQRQQTRSIRGLIDAVERAGRILSEQIVPGLRVTLTAMEQVRPAEGEDASPGPVRAAPARPPTRAVAPSDGLTEAQQRILNVLATFDSLTPGRAPSKRNVAVFAGVSPKSGSYYQNLGVLRAAGLIDYPQSDLVALTDAGAARAEPDAAFATLDQLHAAWRSKLSTAEAAILDVLIAAYPDSVAKADVADRVGVSSKSGSFYQNLGTLRSLGLIDYPRPTHAVALDALFPEGLR